MKSDDPAMLNEFCELALQDVSSECAEKKTQDPSLPEDVEAIPGAADKNETPVDSEKDVEDMAKMTQPQGQEATESSFIDVEGDRNVNMPEMPSRKLRCDSAATGSDSGDDEVVFPGRGRLNAVVITDDPFPMAPAKGNVGYANVLPERASPSTLFPHSYAQPQEPAARNLRGNRNYLSVPLSGTPGRRHGSSTSRRKPKRRKFPSEVDDDEAVLADYIANILEDTSSDDASPETEGINSRENGLRGRAQSREPTSLYNDMRVYSSHDSEETENGQVDVVQVLEEDGSAQPGDDKKAVNNTEHAWIPLHQKMASGSGSDASPDKINSTERSFGGGDAQQVPDESSAYAYEPREGPTIPAEDLLFDEDVASDVSGDMDYDIPAVAKGWRREPRRTQFPTASAFADALDGDPYGAFDIMNFDRPSLKKKSKGKRSVPEFGLSDSELESQIELSWESDRKKKKLKKQQREELRINGQLGKKSKKANAQSTERTIEDAISEIRGFLMSDNERYAS